MESITKLIEDEQQCKFKKEKKTKIITRVAADVVKVLNTENDEKEDVIVTSEIKAYKKPQIDSPL